MSTLVEIEKAIDRFPDWDVYQLIGCLEKRQAQKSHRTETPSDPDLWSGVPPDNERLPLAGETPALHSRSPTGIGFLVWFSNCGLRGLLESEWRNHAMAFKQE